MREAFLITTTTCQREEEKRKKKKERRKGLRRMGKNYPRAGEEQKQLEEMLRLRLLSPLPHAEPQKPARWLLS